MRRIALIFVVGVGALFVGELNRQAVAAPVVVDDAKAQAVGIRKLVGRHLVLYTDLASAADVDSLPAVFDQAVPQWAEYFGIDEAKSRDWQVRAFLIGDRKPFDNLGVMPADQSVPKRGQASRNSELSREAARSGSEPVPFFGQAPRDGATPSDAVGVGSEPVPFLHGLSAGSDLWLYDQPTAYYRRHLLLHEGTHAFMGKFLGGCGPGWYMEGTAELFGTHRLEAGSREQGAGSESGAKRGQAPRDNTSSTGELNSGSEPVPFLQMRIIPRSREEVPMWGRIKLIRDAVAAGHALDLPAVMKFDNHKQLDNESYAWCWAAAKFLDSHPRYRDRFRGLKGHVSDRDFNDSVRQVYGADWANVLDEWQAFVATLDYGYDFERTAIELQRGTPLAGKSRSVKVAADRGWQSSGVWLEAGKTYHVAASGRYQIAVEKTSDGEKPWPCEPGGVTIKYHDGRPLGMLLGAIVEAGSREQGAGSEGGKNVDGKTRTDTTGFARPIAIGLGCAISPEASGTLYLRVNDSAARLEDNRGSLTVTIED